MYERSINQTLRERLLEPRRTIQVLQGPRQVGKTTSIKQVLAKLGRPSQYASADAPELQEREWIATQWDVARRKSETEGGPAILVLDEVQKVPRWSDVVKQLWDEDTFADRDIRVVLLGSSPLLVGRGLSESLSGRFETIPATHWTYAECRDAFGWDPETYVFFGGYPGGAPYVGDEDRWRDYIRQTAIETTVSREVLHMSRVDKPALMRRLLYLTAEYSGRELSYRKMQGQLTDAGNTTTLAHYLDLLQGAGLASGLMKYSAQPVRRRASSPKLLVHNTALMSAMSPRSFAQARADTEWWGRLVESCVGAYLVGRAQGAGRALYYWRHADREVDFVFVDGTKVTAIEVKTGAGAPDLRGLAAFREAFGDAVETLVVGTGGVPVDELLAGTTEI